MKLWRVELERTSTAEILVVAEDREEAHRIALESDPGDILDEDEEEFTASAIEVQPEEISSADRNEVVVGDDGAEWASVDAWLESLKTDPPEDPFVPGTPQYQAEAEKIGQQRLALDGKRKRRKRGEPTHAEEG